MRSLLFASGVVMILLLGPVAVLADEIVRVGLIQMDAREFDKEYNLRRAETLTRAAAARGASIVCMPEATVQGYPRVHLAADTAADDPGIVERRAGILEAAESVPGPSTGRIAAIARDLGIWIVFGIDENRGGRLFNTAILMSPRGEIVGKYSKVHLQNWMVASGVNRGDGFPVWDVEIAGVRTRIGVEICYDIQHPESTRELALGGAEIAFVPYCTTDFSRPLLVHLFQTRALENQIFVVRVNYAAPRNSGTSSIIGFEGSTQDELDRAEGVLVGNLNLTSLRKARSVWNPVYGPANRHPPAYRRLRGNP